MPFLKLFHLSPIDTMLENGSSNMHKILLLKNAIKIMVIHHNKNFLSFVSDFLKSHSFEVTCVDQAFAALRMLTENKEDFDLILIDSDMKDVDTITFLRLTKNMGILSIVMCQEIDDSFLLEVYESGGLRVVKAPLTDEIVKHARDDVLRARVVKFEQVKMFGESETMENGSLQDGSEKRKSTKRCSTRELPNGQLLESVPVKKRIYVQWTQELHSKFLRAIHELGEGKCQPRNILEAMGVPGLTRKQVASHLQKCRLDVTKILQGRRAPCSSSNKRSLSNLSQEVDSTTFGNMPSLPTHVGNHCHTVTSSASTFPGNQGQLDMQNQPVTHVSFINGVGSKNHGQVYFVPPDSDRNGFQPNQVSDDFFDIPNGMVENSTTTCIEHNVWGPNTNNISEPVLPDYDQIMPNQDTLEFNQDI